MKRVSLVVMMAVLALTSVAYAVDSVTWLTLKEGAARAKVEKKPMLVDFFYGKGCPRCEKLEKAGYKDPAIAKRIMDDFIPVRVDLTKELTKEEKELGEKNDYKKECLLLFLDPEGNTIKDTSGKRISCAAMMDSDLLLKYLDTVKASLAKDKH